MKVFISWSEPRSRAMAQAIADALPVMIQAVEPFFSPEIEKGTAGDLEIHTALEGTGFGIICLTSENLGSTWIHYEAGALAKSGERVWTLLLDVAHADVKPPLSRFQHTMATKEDFFRLVESINANLPQAGDKALPPHTLRTAFEKNWPDLDTAFERARDLGVQGGAPKGHRPDRDLLEEILGLLRAQELPRGSVDGGSATGRDADRYWPYVLRLGATSHPSRVRRLLEKFGIAAVEEISPDWVIAVFAQKLPDSDLARLRDEAGLRLVLTGQPAVTRSKAMRAGLEALPRRAGSTLADLLTDPAATLDEGQQLFIDPPSPSQLD